MEIITPHQALAKAYKFCAYQERSQQEVREKLKSFLITSDEVENIIVNLIENNFINEERFAIAFAGGKFRINKWGKLKIKTALKQKGVSDYCIKKGLATIGNDDYSNTIDKLIKSKLKTMSVSDKFTTAKKLSSYLLSKGFENEISITKVKQALKM